MKTKSDICNLALSRLGEKNTVENIDNPTTQAEKVFAKWYDVTRRAALRKMMPNFARAREIWAKSDYKPAFGYEYAYDYRTDCVKIIGIGNMDNPDNDYVVEGGHLLSNGEYESGLPVRYVKDIEDIGKFDDNFIELFSLLLAYNVAPELTESAQRLAQLQQIIPSKMAEVMAVASQENKPIIIKHSRLKAARRGLYMGVSKH